MTTSTNTPLAEADGAVVDPEQLRRATLASSVGSALEYYDFYIYGLASALIFGPLFFKPLGEDGALIASFATYGVGFAARPFGGMVFGYIGDRFGRKMVLILTIGLMGTASFAIGLLPTYEQAGMLGAVLLVTLRILQGLGAGAEQAGATTLISEVAPRRRRGFFASLPFVGIQLGTLLGAGTFALIAMADKAVLEGWLWRVPFLASVLLVVVAIFIRLRLKETPVFQELEKHKSVVKNPIGQLWKHSKKNVLIGIGLGVLLQPGAGTGISQEAKYAGKSGDWWAFLTGLFPKNFLGLGATTTVTDGVATTAVSFNVLQILVIAIAVGIAALKVGKAAEPFLALNASALAVIQKVLWWIIRIAPLGTVGLIGNAVAVYGWDTIGSLGKFTVAIYIGLALVLFVVYPVLIRSHGLSIRQYYSGVWPAVQLAFVSRSSIGTLPLTQRVTERSLGVPRAYASFAVPLGATTKMDGCAAIYPAVAAIFVAQFFGIQLDFTQYLLIALVSVLGSAATAGTTGAVVMLTLTLSTLGLPLAGVGLLLAIDPILDMGRTAVNVAGQALIPAIVAKRQGILDETLYNAPRNGDPFSDDVDGTAAVDPSAAATPAAGRDERELADARA
ncbi:Proline/betaine transporter [Microbacterium sp. Bi128]|nr:Proline/betaine transporter [Microbacterium sp. Bi128]